jgi:NAD(P)H-dependent FMN reductase
MTEALNIAVIIGSTREDRQGGKVADWFLKELDAHDEFAVDVVDLRSVDLPDVQYNGHPKMHQYPSNVAAFAEHIGAADGFVVITPEYNHGYPASLKHALDMVYREWNAKPMAFVGYGGAAGGSRAIEQLRGVCGELHVVDLRDTVLLSFVNTRFEDDGSLKADPVVADQVKLTLNSLKWWARSLKNARAAEAYPA